MTELYRGILTILNTALANLMEELRAHVRSFNIIYTKQGTEYDFGVFGFWNLMLEVILNFYIIACKFFGVALIFALAISFYPLYALMNVLARGFSGILSEDKIKQTSTENTPKTDKK